MSCIVRDMGKTHLRPKPVGASCISARLGISDMPGHWHKRLRTPEGPRSGFKVWALGFRTPRCLKTSYVGVVLVSDPAHDSAGVPLGKGSCSRGKVGGGGGEGGNSHEDPKP